jgi:hypothetical protein
MPVYVGGDTQISYPIPISKGGTGSTSFTQGSVIFMGAATLHERNYSFFWDDTNIRLGICTNTPQYSLHVNSGDIWAVGTSEGTFHWGEASGAPPVYTDDMPKEHCGRDPKYYLATPEAWVLIHINGVDYELPAYLPR